MPACGMIVKALASNSVKLREAKAKLHKFDFSDHCYLKLTSIPGSG